VPFTDAFRAAMFFVPACLPLLLTVVAVVLLNDRRRRKADWDQRWFILAFGLLGGIAGLITGVAKDASIVNGLLTGLLGVVTALLSYLFGKESLAAWRPAIPLAMIVLVVNALMGLSIGGTYKSDREEFEREYARWLLRYERVDLTLERARGMAEIRRNAAAQAVAVVAPTADASVGPTADAAPAPEALPKRTHRSSSSERSVLKKLGPIFKTPSWVR
jgi:predicted nucleic acid-binding protein